ncbi:tyrosyl-DNA phosphodiesterase 1, partial [Tremellales sp. Uapishka_1]
MDSDDFDVAALLGGGGYYVPPAAARPPCPPPGRNREFDNYCETVFGNEEKGDGNKSEIRRAAWATWKISAPTGHAGPSGTAFKEDDDLARVLALSAREYQARSSTSRPRSQSEVISVSDDEDEELRKAIALSQAEGRAPKRLKREETPEEERRMLAEAMAASLVRPAVQVVEDDSDDEELIASNAAYQASREASREAQRRKREVSKTAGAATAAPDPSIPAIEPKPDNMASSSTLKVGGKIIDRAQLEKERRERQAAREAKAGTPEIPAKKLIPVTKIESSGLKSPSGPKIKKFADLRNGSTTSGPSTSTSSSGLPTNGVNLSAPAPGGRPFYSSGRFPSDAAGEYYLDGELRHNDLSYGNASTDRTFSLPQIVGDKSQIALIIICAFVLDDEWLEDILPSPEVVPRVMIRPQPSDKQAEWNGKVQAQVNGEVRCYPQMMTGYMQNGSAHMKFAWIFYKTGRLRVMVSTANLVHYDWDFIENTVFVQDFLPLSTPQSLRENHLPHDFPFQFRWLFIHLKVHKALKYLISQHPQGAEIPFSPEDGFLSMTKWDWSRVKAKVVMSVPDSYVGYGAMDQFGICRLGRLLDSMGWKPQRGERVVAEYQGSSLGSYDINWFNLFYQFCCGNDAKTLSLKGKATSWPPMKVIFPTLATVDQSLAGRDGGGTMFCGRAYNSVTARLFHDANSKRGGVLMHSKVLIALFEPLPNTLGFASSVNSNTSPTKGKRKAGNMDSNEADEDVGGWVYVGSHNFSAAAWGSVNYKKSPPTLFVKNYELGIVFPLPRKGAQRIADAIAPHRRPARPYGQNDVPWSQEMMNA